MLNPSIDANPRARRSRLRRSSQSASASADLRKTRRLFGRSSTVGLGPLLHGVTHSSNLSQQHPAAPTVAPDEDDAGRRSFLAKPPAPGAARRVLTVLNQQQKHSKRAATFVNTRPSQAVQAAVSASGYDVDHSLLPDDRDDIRSDSDVDLSIRPTPTKQITSSVPPIISPPISSLSSTLPPPSKSSSSTSHDTPNRPIDYPPPPPSDRRVSPVRDDATDSVNRLDSVNLSMHSSRALANPRLIEAEASEVSDDITSSADPKSRTSGPTHSSGDAPSSRNPDDLIFIDDLLPHSTSAVIFSNVGEEDPPVPHSSPSAYGKRMDAMHVWATFEHRLHALQEELKHTREARDEQQVMVSELEGRNAQLVTLLDAARTRSGESLAEVESLARQVKETRKRLSRRVRELEEHVSMLNLQHAEDVEHHQDVERRLRDEIVALRAGLGPDDVPNAAGALVVASSKSQGLKLANKTRFTAGAPSPSGNSVGSVGGVGSYTQMDVKSRAPLSAGSATDSGAAMGTAVGAAVGRARTVSAIASEAVGPRRKGGRDTPASIGSSVGSGTETNGRGTPGGSRGRAGVRRMATTAGGIGMIGMDGSRTNKTMARRNLIRRALIAHIQSGRYRSARAVWVEFFCAEGGHVTPEQFARAVRGLAVAADARDRDLEVLREEVCGAEVGDTGVMSWAMFARFYQRTRNEST